MSYESLISYLLGVATTLLATYFNYWLTNKTKTEEQLKIRSAINALFISCIIDLKEHINTLRQIGTWEFTTWENVFWDKNQIVVAQYFPEIAGRFAELVTSTNSFRRSSPILDHRELSALYDSADLLLKEIES